MAASAADRVKLRRMVGEPTRKVYDDDALDGYIEAYPLHDLDGNEPFTEGSDGSLEENSDWTATYDLNAAAADIWLEKAGTKVDERDHQEAGGRLGLWRGDAKRFEHAEKMHRKYAARRAARSVRLGPLDDELFGESEAHFEEWR